MPSVIGLAAVFGTFSLLAVILRFYARSRTKAPYGADDWFSLASLVTLFIWMGVVIWTSVNGAHLSPKVMVPYLKGVYLTALLSTFPITAAKLSILFLYRRIFYNDKRFRRATTIVGVLCLLWFVAATIAVSLKCVPVRKSWLPLLPGTCFNIQVFQVAVECPNSFLDFVIMALPVGVIKGLHLPLKRRILVCCIFALGGFVGIIGFIRIALVYKPTTLNLTLLGHWLQIQLSIAVICACLPTYGPLLPGVVLVTRAKAWYSSFASVLKKSRQHLTSSSGSSDSHTAPCPNCGHHSGQRPQHDRYNNLSDASNEKVVVTRIVGGKAGSDGSSYPPSQQDSFEATSSTTAGAGSESERERERKRDTKSPENFIRIRNEVEMV